MSHQTMVTVQGWIGTTPTLREVGGVPVLNFRLGCTPRHFHRASGAWVDGQTQWYGVSAWRRLATHGGPSLRQGDPVLVHGRLEHRTYVNKSGVEVVALEIEAVTIGHDLTRGVATFVKAASGGTGGDPDHDREAAAA
ncbi:single-stranded DNA-binding protein [Nocardioides sp. R1-1]|uniref:single-stranded DNA-binding protein n=1 Tax=Nocardioides sp. R1-1 TaxID=3383502 RepID=UPI0038D127B4